ncbi:hypothetical protein [Actinomadura physcomitrii]|uniref:hypothetical protein n=1 Tax=Actinomadura physcomitrii TaxID=2650748 RepID=UPI0019218483|nr:hypothetical protein [Actinomadura physcomitrii]
MKSSRIALSCSALGGKYSRLFVGLTKGWYTPGPEAPTCEDIVEHLPEIDDRASCDVPLSGLDEMDTVISAKRGLGRS